MSSSASTTTTDRGMLQTTAAASPSLMIRSARCLSSIRRFLDSHIGAPPQNPDGSVKGQKTDKLVTKVPPTGMDIVGLAGVGSAIVTMTMTSGHVVDAACWTTIGMAPLAAYQKRHLKSLGGLRGQQNILRDHVNELYLQVRKTKQSVDKLESNVDKLESVEKELATIAEEKKTNVDRLVHIVTENGKLQSLIKKKLEQQIMQQLVQVVILADANKDFTVNKEERNMLVTRLNLMPGFDLDEANFNKLCPPHKELELAKLMAVLRNLTDDSVPEEENVFHLKPRQLLEVKQK